MMPPVLAGRYRLTSKLGAGGQGSVHEAVDTWAGDRPVAIKRVPDPQYATLEREFSLLRSVGHPSLVRALDLFRAEGAAHLVESRIEGEAFGTWARWRSPEEIFAVLAPVVHALAHLHARGLVHMDPTPSNILVTAGDAPRGILIDLGLSRPAGVVGAAGSPGFAAPETLASEPVTARGDIYTLGATLVAALTQAEPALRGRPEIRGVEPAAARELVARCLMDAPASRPDAVELSRRCAELGGISAEFLDRPLAQLPACGRRDALQALDRWLTEGTGAFVVTGAEAMGKSTMLESAADRGRLAGMTVLAVSAGEPGAAETLLNLAAATAESAAVAELGRDAARVGAAELAQRLVLALDALAHERSILVTLDDAERAGPAMRRALELWRTREVEHGPRIVVAQATAERPSITLEPIDVETVAEILRMAYAHDRPEAEATALIELCGGAPGSVLAALAVMERTGKTAIELAASDLEPAPGLPAALRPLQVLEDPVPEAVLRALLGDDGLDALGDAIARGFLRVLAGSPRRYQLAATRRRAGSDDDGEACARVAGALAEAGDDARAAVYYARAGEVAAAVTAMGRAVEAGAPWFAFATRLADLIGVEAMGDALLARWGERAAALGDVSAARRAADAGATGRHTVAAACVKSGDYEEALAEVPDPASAADAAVRARALLFTGRSDQSRDLAEAWLDRAEGPARLDLLDALGHARFNLGDAGGALDALESALSAAEELGDADQRGRAQHALAIALHRTGSWPRAMLLYRASLELADPLARVTRGGNLATLLQNTGEWVEARQRYDEAYSRALALANVRAQERLAVNLANLQLWMGELGLAERLAEGSARAAGAAGRSHAAGMAGLVAAEAALERQDLGASQRYLDAAQEHLAEVEDEVAGAECALLRARLRAASGDIDGARGELDRIDAKAGDHLVRQLAYWSARIGLGAAARPTDGDVESAERAVTECERAGDREMRWRALAVKSRLHEKRGENEAFAATRLLASAALDEWKGVLSPDAHAPYFGTSARRELQRWVTGARLEAVGSSTVTPGMPFMRRLVAINRRLAREKRVDTLLELIIDTAIELLGAERGFLILQEPSGVAVAVARNFDKRSLEDGRQRISRSIASEVLESGEPIVTTNAQQDERFAGIASVANLRVRSVMCVPLRAATRDDDPLIGALYLDHRFQDRAFTEDDAELASSFADQAAIAVENARLITQIREQERELATQNERLAQLNEQLQKEAAAYAAEAEAALRRLREEGPTLGVGRGFEGIVGKSDRLREALRLVERFADTDVPVMISGESGTGKELIARAIHERSARSRRSFVSINCGAIPETLIESELFGYKKGAFTGANRDKPGLFAAAERGTLFLDEIGEMPATMQVKLLRVLQENEYRPVGATSEIACNVRVVSASHRDLGELVRTGAFREDLFYRMQVVEIVLPALRERREDIPALVDHFCREISGEPADVRFDQAAIAALLGYDWPGNVRELENEVRRALALADDVVRPEDLSERFQQMRAAGATTLAEISRGSLREITAGFERQVLLATLRRTGWNVRKTAKELGLSRAALYTRLNRFGITREQDN